MNRCDGCAFWVEDNSDWRGSSFGFRKCSVIIHFDKLEDAAEEAWRKENPSLCGDDASEDLMVAATDVIIKATKAYTIDGSNYVAELWTGPDFGCVKWEAQCST